MRLPSWLTAPVFDDPIKTHEAYLLHVILCAMLLVPLPYVLGVALLDPAGLPRALGQAAFGELANVSLFVLLRSGYVRVASLLQVIAFFVFVGLSAATGGGTAGPAYSLGFALVIVIAGALLGVRGAAISCVAALAAGAFVVFGPKGARALGAGAASPELRWVVSLVIFPVIVVVQYLAERTVRSALARATESERRYRSYLTHAPTGVFIVERGGRICEVNEMATQLTGLSRDELLAMTAQELVVERERALTPRQLGNVFAIGSVHVEMAVRHRLGVDVHLHVDAVKLSEQQALIFATDISERRYAEESLRESENRLRTLANASFEGIMIHDGGLIVETNARFAQLFGYQDPSELLGKDGLELMLAPSSRRPLRERLLGADSESVESAVLGVRRDGGTFDGEIQSRPIEYKGRRLRVVAVRDVSERKRAEAEHERLERQLAQARRLESIGRLAGGVAHDFNNILTGIMGNVSLLRLALKPGESASEHLDEVMRACESATRLTRQLLMVGRQQAVAPVRLDANRALKEAQKLLTRVLGERVTLATSLDPALRPIHMDPAQFEQIVVNLCVNARDAMPHGGRIEIQTENVSLSDEGAREYADAAPGDFVRIGVSDDGVGMSSEVLAHAFEPFFTTKEPGCGTGLGLATVHGIVKQNGGFIHVESRPEHGTRFGIYVPSVVE